MISIRSLFPVLSKADAVSSDSAVIFLGKAGVDFDSSQYDLIKSQAKDKNKEREREKESKIFRLSLFLTDKDQFIFTAPCGPDKSEGLEDLSFCVRSGLSLLHRLGVNPKIGIISGGRGGDLGRSAAVDQTIHNAESLVRLLQKENISAKHYTILIEDAIKEADFLILPDSLSGEMILKTVSGIGSGREIGNILLVKNGNETEMNAQKTLFIEQMTKNANEEDALILREALLKSF
jgi:predicted methyltransferase MtxX (methanogen marker protein 4)